MNLLLTPNPLIFFILAVVCFSAFLVILLWYIFTNKKDNKKNTKTWTIESARKFLESQNIDINEINKNKNGVKNTIKQNSDEKK